MEYTIRTEEKFGPLTLIDVAALADACTDRWWNQTLCRVNDSAVRLGVHQGEFHWHKHEREDELFYVIEGVLLVDLRDRSIALQPRQGILVPRGVEHRTRAPSRTVILMVEAATAVPTGD
jgi:mannose-6-phosphate isomerase-like protein (cupin superfamily)